MTLIQMKKYEDLVGVFGRIQDDVVRQEIKLDIGRQGGRLILADDTVKAYLAAFESLCCIVNNTATKKDYKVTDSAVYWSFWQGHILFGTLLVVLIMQICAITGILRYDIALVIAYFALFTVPMVHFEMMDSYQITHQEDKIDWIWGSVVLAVMIAFMIGSKYTTALEIMLIVFPMAMVFVIFAIGIPNNIRYYWLVTRPRRRLAKKREYAEIILVHFSPSCFHAVAETYEERMHILEELEHKLLKLMTEREPGALTGWNPYPVKE